MYYKYSTVLMCRRDRPYSTHCKISVLYTSYLNILESLLLNSVPFIRHMVQLLCPYLVALNDPVNSGNADAVNSLEDYLVFNYLGLNFPQTDGIIGIFTRAVSCSAMRSLLLPPIDGRLSVLQQWKGLYWIMVIHDCGKNYTENKVGIQSICTTALHISQ